MRYTDSIDGSKRFFRSEERLFQVNGKWFFAAREGDMGPFVTRTEAEEELRRYVVQRRELDHFQHQRDAERRSNHDRSRPYAMELLPLGER